MTFHWTGHLYLNAIMSIRVENFRLTEPDELLDDIYNQNISQ